LSEFVNICNKQIWLIRRLSEVFSWLIANTRHYVLQYKSK
jgi:hypothetical protein